MRDVPISIVTCVLNQREDHFLACAKSVSALAADVEWIVVDDGSSDEFKRKCDNILGEIPETHPIKKINLAKNVGLSAARNSGISISQGNWIVVLDSDDELMPDIVTILRSLDRDTALACFGVEYLKTDGTIETRTNTGWRRLFQRYALTVADPFLWFDFYYHGIIARRETIEAIGGYRNRLVVGEDQDILLRACEYLRADNISFIDRLGYRYRENPFGVCETRWPEVEENYASTMIEAAKRRGASFDACRLANERNIDGALVDEYEYRLKGRWIRWNEMVGHDVF